jgi:RNA polymerase sigma factor (sigma-70 family)
MKQLLPKSDWLAEEDQPGTGMDRQSTPSRARSADDLGRQFEAHAKAIYNFCFRRTGDWAAAEDLTSIVFLEAWRLRKRDVPDHLTRAWLFGIANNVVRNRRRSERRYERALRRLPLDRVEADFADEVATRIDDARTMQNMLAALARLPKRELEVISLCVWSELSYEEVSVALSVPIGTVRSRLSRARGHLNELTKRNGSLDMPASEVKR